VRGAARVPDAGRLGQAVAPRRQAIVAATHPRRMGLALVRETIATRIADPLCG
jgi:hypothetical protein